MLVGCVCVLNSDKYMQMDNNNVSDIKISTTIPPDWSSKEQVIRDFGMQLKIRVRLDDFYQIMLKNNIF